MLKWFFNRVWDFCRTRFQSQQEADIPRHVKDVIWVAKYAIYTSHSIEREQLWCMKQKLVKEIEAANPNQPVARSLNLDEAMEGFAAQQGAVLVELRSSDKISPSNHNTKKRKR